MLFKEIISGIPRLSAPLGVILKKLPPSVAAFPLLPLLNIFEAETYINFISSEKSVYARARSCDLMSAEMICNTSRFLSDKTLKQEANGDSNTCCDDDDNI